jgi:hypothetical protein
MKIPMLLRPARAALRSEALRRGAWRGAGGQAQMGEDFDNHRRIFDA